MLQIADNFNLRRKAPLDVRQQFKTIDEMRDYSENYVPEGIVSFNLEDFKSYQYKSTNIYDSKYGKWREFGGDDTDLEIISTKIEPEFGEVGINNNIIITWEYNKSIDSQKVHNNVSNVDALDDNTGLIRTLAVSSDADVNYTITGTDRDGASASATVYFKVVSPCYVNTVDDVSTINETAITTTWTKMINENKEFLWEDFNCPFEIPVIVIPSKFGELESIIDQHGLEYITSFDKQDITINSVAYYMYVFNGKVGLVNHTFIIK